jgi:formiminotetrahydrofolate cyclodeaminase
MSPAGTLIGLGGGTGLSFADQVPKETDEQRKKRLQALQASQQRALGGGYSEALSSAGQFLNL